MLSTAPSGDNTKPTANAGSDQTVNVGTPVTFDASASTDNVSIVSYEWNFGDGTTGTGKTTTHAYTNLGAYTVTLTVKDAANNTGTDQLTVTVQPSTEGANQMPIPNYLWILLVFVLGIFGAAIAAVVLGRKWKK
jgi:PKD repeat protein